MSKADSTVKQFFVFYSTYSTLSLSLSLSLSLTSVHWVYASNNNFLDTGRQTWVSSKMTSRDSVPQTPLGAKFGGSVPKLSNSESAPEGVTRFLGKEKIKEDLWSEFII